MNLDVIIAQLREHAPLYESRVGGAIQFQVLTESANLQVPAAYVLPMVEQGEEQGSRNGYQQTVREQFAVVVALSNRQDERGQTAASNLDLHRNGLFRALLGFQASAAHEVIEFEGSQLLHLDRARLYYRFEFAASYAISTEDTWIPLRNAQLPDFERLALRVDAIDPFDPNRPAQDFPHDPDAYPGGEGPDGRIEIGADIALPNT